MINNVPHQRGAFSIRFTRSGPMSRIGQATNRKDSAKNT